MQNRQYLLWIALILLINNLHAQTTYLPLWSKEGWLLDRMEIKAQSDNDLNLSVVKPYMRKAYVAVADSFRQLLLDGQVPAGLTAVDQYNLNRFQANSSEYSRFTKETLPAWKSKKPLGTGFFGTPGNMIEVDEKGFYLSINPAINQQQGIESDFDDRVYVNALGLTGRGLIGEKVGFQFLATTNREMGPLQFRRFVHENAAIPGAMFWDSLGNGKGYSYTDIRGSVNTNITRYINVQAGYDQHFIGSGYRSLILSNFSPNALFLKLNTRIWKLNYTNLFMQLSPGTSSGMNDGLDNKFASMHHLGVNVTPWLTVGAFEAIIFGRTGGFDISYLQPMIFLRSIEQQNGSPDNANIGLDLKANIAKKGQVYAQLMLDEFRKDEVIGSNRNWWGNKQGFQIGAKYVDAFGIANLDLQAEVNQVRPFMYQFRDTTGAYSHALQPLAHPIGGNLRELIGIIRYQPLNRLYLFGRINSWKQGLDSAGFNFGSNPNRLYSNVASGGGRLRGDNYPMFTGQPARGFNGSFTISYEVKENLFVDLNALYRVFKEADKDRVTTSVLSLGIRWNMFRRDYDY